MPKIKVYLDNCAYNRPFDDQTRIKIALETEAKKHIQRLITEKAVDLVYSYINRLENDDNPFTTRKNSINEFFREAAVYIDSGYAETVEERAAGIMRSGVKTRDALHIACAAEGGCGYFITTDKPLLQYAPGGIIVCNPIQFLDYYEEEKNE
ncbi:MAG: type II toxin-antitoxin system VapC family toxin [Treponema sp.]|nr:type II toxin-antitoxin system VapC family toxin [Treponema sp.]